MAKQLHAFKVTQEVSDRLDKLCKGLPLIARTDANGKVISRKVEITGHQLLKDGYIPAKGERVYPEGVYRVNRIQYVNHRLQLSTMYQDKGEEGIVQYLDYVKTLRTAAQIQLERSMEGSGFFGKLWIAVKSWFGNKKLETTE